MEGSVYTGTFIPILYIYAANLQPVSTNVTISFSCGGGCQNGCDPVNGTCSCRSGWQAPNCIYCSQGNWGTNCSLTCGRGCEKGFCNNVSGSCQCRNGWRSFVCDECSDGRYNKSNDCKNACGGGCNNICSRTDGTCQCRPGWQPPLCQYCLNGQYNVSNDCQNTCGEGCNGTCSRTDGTCQCRPGWQPPLCQYCSDGHYNVSNDCQNTCGEGCHDTCSRTNGTCQCQSGWQPPLCQYTKNSDDKEKTTLIWHLAGGIGGGVLIFLIGTFFGMCLGKCRGREQHRGSMPPLADILSPCDQSELQTRNYENVISMSSHEYEVLDKRGDVSQKVPCTEVNRRCDYENTPVTMIPSAYHNYQILEPTELTTI